MIKDKKNIDLLFEEGLKGFRSAPPVNSWERLESDLDKSNLRTSFVYVRWIAASILLLIAFGAGYFYATYKTDNRIEIAKETTQPTHDRQLIAPSNTNSEIELPVEKTIIEKKSTTNLSGSSPLTENKTFNLADNTIDNKSKTNLIKKDNEISEDIPINEAITEENKNNEIVESVFIEVQNNEEIQILPDQEEEKILITDNELANLDLYQRSEVDNNLGIENKKQLKWSVGAQFAPVISYRDISGNNQQNSTINNTESELNGTEESLLSYSGGVDISYNIGKRWSIQSGVYLSRIGQVNNDALNFKQSNSEYLLYAINTSTGDINLVFEKVPEDIRKINPPKDTLESIDVSNIKVVQNFDLFEIPLVVKYKILNNKFGINVSGGLSPAYLIGNNTNLEVDGEKYNVGSSANLNTMIFNTIFSLGINYALSQKLSVNMEPTFKYSLNPINNNSQFNYHPYYFSWFAGIRYSF